MSLEAENDSSTAARGRPRLHSDDELLAAALDAFAAVGYEGMTMRSINRTLGLSHGTYNKRFGSKEQLFRASVDYGFTGLSTSIADHLARWPVPGNDREALRSGLRAFLLASAERPELVRLMNTLGINESKRLDYVFERYIEPTVQPLRAAVERSRSTGASVISTRELFFLVAHGAAAPFTLRGLSDHFDGSDGRLDPETYAERMAEVLVNTLGI